MGIVFLHGMGEFRRGDTLRRFGEPIYAWLDSWRAWSSAKPVLFADDTSLRLPHLDEPDAPPHIQIKITWPDLDDPNKPPKRTQTWIAAEGWWSDEFTPPAFSEVASWSMALAPGMLVRFFKYSLGDSRLFGLYWGWAALPLGYLAAGLFQIVLMALTLIGMVPFLRRYVAGVQVVLIGALGDPLVMVASPIRFNAILSRIERNIDWLRNQRCCQRIAIVSHSQGTGIGLRVLQRHSKDVTLFVTCGTAIEKLHIAAELQAIRRRLGLAITLSSACLAMVAAAGILTVVLYHDSDDYREALWWWAGISIAVMLAVGAFITWWSGKQIAKVKSPDLTVPIMGKDGVTTEPRPLTWHDLWSVSDPFPDKDLPEDGAPDPANRTITRESWRIVNRADVFKDHSLYEENHEGFVGPVFTYLAEFAELDPALPQRLAEPLREGMRIRKRRVAALGFARLIGMVAAIALPLLSLARGELGSLGRPFESALEAISAWLGFESVVNAIEDTNHLDETIGALIVVVLVIAWYRLAIMEGWLIWDKAEADLLAIRELELPVAAGPYVLNAGRLKGQRGLDENDTPGGIAALDRANGVWLFFLTTLALPLAFGVMSFVEADWDGFKNDPLRWTVAVVVLLLSGFWLWLLIRRALGRWIFPIGVTPPAQTPS